MRRINTHGGKHSGGYSSEVPPLPIPNREVKLTHADGTAYLGGRVGSRLFKGRSNDLPFLFLFVRGIRQIAASLFYFMNGRGGYSLRSRFLARQCERR